MDSKTLTTLAIVFICILFLPVMIGLIGGIVGLIGGLVGGLIGAVGAIFGAVFGLFGSMIGWLFGGHYWAWPYNFFNRDVFIALLIVLVVVLLTRSKTPRAGNRGQSR